jgi:hypothetical protein
MDINEAVQNSDAAKRAIAFHIAQTTPNPTKEQLKAAGLDPDVKRAEEPVSSGSEIVYTNDVSKLPKGSSARIITDGVIEVMKTTNTKLDISPEIKAEPQPEDSITFLPAPENVPESDFRVPFSSNKKVSSGGFGK